MEMKENKTQLIGHDPGSSQSQDESNGSWDIIRELGDLPLGAIVSEEGLAKIFGRHHVSIKRAVQRGELPPSVRLFGVPVWTVDAIRQHLRQRLETALKESAFYPANAFYLGSAACRWVG